MAHVFPNRAITKAKAPPLIMIKKRKSLGIKIRHIETFSLEISHDKTKTKSFSEWLYIMIKIARLGKSALAYRRAATSGLSPR